MTDTTNKWVSHNIGCIKSLRKLPGDAVHHQHRRLGQLRVARPEQLAARTGQQILAVEAPRVFQEGLEEGRVFLHPEQRKIAS